MKELRNSIINFTKKTSQFVYDTITNVEIKTNS